MYIKMNFSVFYVFLFLYTSCAAYTPIVLWHGMGDSCCFSGSLGRIQTLLENLLPNVTIVSLRFGNNVIEDVENSYFGNANIQVQQACETITNNPELANGYNAIGFSQGAQLLRAVAQRCPQSEMRALISLGGQHQGVFGLPRCDQPQENLFCEYMRTLLSYGAYNKWIQNRLIQAQYWHDPLHEDEYRDRSIFLADINNEREDKNDEYASNLNKLQAFVLVKFNQDSMVAPRESSWFGFYAPGQDKEVITYSDTNLYLEDYIGLRQLDEEGRLHFLSTDGDHLQFTEEWFTENIVTQFLEVY